MDPALSWDRSYARQRAAHVYKGENIRLRENNDGSSDEELTTKFLEYRKRNLDPPVALMYASIDNFLRRICFRSPQTKCVLFDRRHDPTGGSTSTRLWDSEGDGKGILGYMNYPPKGEEIVSCKLDIPSLKSSMRERVRILNIFRKIPCLMNCSAIHQA